jgi:hypothetical protein
MGFYLSCVSSNGVFSQDCVVKIPCVTSSGSVEERSGHFDKKSIIEAVEDTSSRWHKSLLEVSKIAEFAVTVLIALPRPMYNGDACIVVPKDMVIEKG